MADHDGSKRPLEPDSSADAAAVEPESKRARTEDNHVQDPKEEETKPAFNPYASPAASKPVATEVKSPSEVREGQKEAPDDPIASSPPPFNPYAVGAVATKETAKPSEASDGLTSGSPAPFNPYAVGAVAAKETDKPSEKAASDDEGGEGPTERVADVENDAFSAAALIALADRLAAGGEAPPHSKIAESLRGGASRMLRLERRVQEFGQALLMVNQLSAASLRGGGFSESGGDHQESERSYLHKKGDADLQEAHRAAAVVHRQNSGGTVGGGSQTSGGVVGGGSLNSASKPMTKEEMDKARRERLDRLEAQQAKKKQELAAADEKTKSREALFNRPLVGPQKSLGKF